MDNKNISETKGKWSFRAYLQSIKHFKWWIIGATVVCMAGGYLAFLLGVNPEKETYSSKFTYNINVAVEYDENSKEGDKKTILNYRFVDGSIFDYKAIVSEAAMKKVVEKNPELYKKVNIEKIIRNNALSIKVDGYENSSTGEFIPYIPYNYELTAKKKYFGSEKVGKQFVQDLIEQTTVTAAEANNKFEITNVIGDSFYDSYLAYQTSLLISEYEDINKTYKTIIDRFSTSTHADDSGVSIGAYYTDFKLSFIDGDATKIDNLRGFIVANRLINYKSGEESETIANIRSAALGYISAIKKNLQTIASDRKTLDSLTAVSILNKSDTEYIETILQLTEEIKDLETKNESMIEYLEMAGYIVPKQVTPDNIDTIVEGDSSTNGYIQHLSNPTADNWNQKCVSAQNDVKTLAEALEAKRLVINDNYHYVYNTYLNRVNYTYSGATKVTGHISNVLGLIIGLVVGFGLHHLSVLVSKFIKKKNNFLI